ncbi:MAG: hypothetical protein FJ290_25650 [Planctomycetes bacterium]|nr:hypothetical protein [Planctomycetota bacterium]
MSTHELALGKATQRLLGQVALRQRLAAAGRRLHLFALALAALYGALLLVSRLLGLIPNWFSLLTLALVPGAALALALALDRCPTRSDAARRVDFAAGTHDLFLTSSLLASSPGEFKPIVLAQAEERAAKLAPNRILPYRWEDKAAHVAAALFVLFLGTEVLPQLDPFGHEKQRQEQAQRRRLLAETQKATEQRLALLQKTSPEAKTSQETRHAIEELKLAFNAMKPKDKEGNLKRLAEAQKDLGALWRKRSEDRLKDAFDRGTDAQRLGSGQGQKAEEMKRRLQRGDPSAIKKEAQEMLEKARRLEQLSDSAEKRKGVEELRQQLKSLSDFLANNATSKSLQEAVNRALEQLTMAENQGLSKEAMKAVQESLKLAGMEMDGLAQAIRDLQALEKGLSAAQLAKMLNALKGLDGAGTEGLKDIEDYEEFYKKLLADGGQGGCRTHGPG